MHIQNIYYFVIICGVFFHLKSNAERFRILGIVSIPIYSHYVAIKPLFSELAARGHDVTVINHFPNKQPIENFTDLVLDNKSMFPAGKPDLNKLAQDPSHFHPTYGVLGHISFAEAFIEQDCYDLFTNGKVLQILKSQKYDVVILEHFVSDCDFVIASYFKPAPVIGISAHTLFPKHYPRIGLPFRSSVDPFPFAPSGTAPTLLERLEILLANLAYGYYIEPRLRAQIKNSAVQYLNATFDDFDELVDDVRMLFVNQYFPLTGTRLKTDQVVDIGGMHLGQTKPLPQDIQHFLDSSPQGVILMSFGSILTVSTMAEEKLKAFFGAFEKYPQNVIMKWESNIESRIENKKILFQSWLPQYDVLCHPNVIGFIYHGGLLGTSEAIQCAVPMIVIPIFGDQYANSAFISESGLGVRLFYKDITLETVTEALKKILTNERRKHVRRLSSAWRDRPMSAVDTAVYWTEYVARHGNRYPVDAPSKKVSAMKYNNIDLFVIVAFMCIGLMFLVYLMSKFVVGLLFFIFHVKANVSNTKKRI